MRAVLEQQQTQTPAAPIRVVIIEDLREVREGLQILINGTHGFRCTGSYRSMEDALARICRSNQPDVILTDIGLPGMSGIGGIRILRERLLYIKLTALGERNRQD